MNLKIKLIAFFVGWFSWCWVLGWLVVVVIGVCSVYFFQQLLDLRNTGKKCLKQGYCAEMRMVSLYFNQEKEKEKRGKRDKNC